MPNCTCRYRRRDRGAAGTPHVLRAISPRLRGRSSSETVYTALVLRRAAPTHMRAGPCSLAWRSYRAQWPGIAGFAVEKADQARNGLARREYMRRHCLCAREAIHYASQHAPPPHNAIKRTEPASISKAGVLVKMYEKAVGGRRRRRHPLDGCAGRRGTHSAAAGEPAAGKGHRCVVVTATTGYVQAASPRSFRGGPPFQSTARPAS